LENRVVFHGRGGVFILVDEVFEEGFDGVENCNQESTESNGSHVVSDAPEDTLRDADTSIS
jgi:hypothetical protein